MDLIKLQAKRFVLEVVINGYQSAILRYNGDRHSQKYLREKKLIHEKKLEQITIDIEFIEWMQDGNAEKIGDDQYVEQTTQWKKKFTLTGLKRFFETEFIN